MSTTATQAQAATDATATANANGGGKLESTIILWALPRSTSTMFERAFLTRSDEFRVLHEPLGDPWYFGLERVSPRFSAEKCAAEFSQYKDMTTLKVWDEVANIGPDPTSMKTFSKDMAQYIFLSPTSAETAPVLPEKEKGNPTLIPESLLLAPHIKHTFLIRTPAKTVPSYYNLCSGENSKITGFDYFSKEEVGIKELRGLYEFISNKTGTKPMIIDSEDLIADPEVMMKKYCAGVGVDFKPSMLKWDPGRQPHFDKWVGWHNDAQDSNGIHKTKKSTSDSRKEWPDEVNEAIRESMDDYEWLRAKRVRLDDEVVGGAAVNGAGKAKENVFIEDKHAKGVGTNGV